MMMYYLKEMEQALSVEMCDDQTEGEAHICVEAYLLF